MIRRVLGNGLVKVAAVALVATSPLASCALATEADAVVDREADRIRDRLTRVVDRTTPAERLAADLTASGDALAVDVVEAAGTLDDGRLVVRIRAAVRPADFDVQEESTRCFRYRLTREGPVQDELRPCP